jgi:hypothetical protein
MAIAYVHASILALVYDPGKPLFLQGRESVPKMISVAVQ